MKKISIVTILVFLCNINVKAINYSLDTIEAWPLPDSSSILFIRNQLNNDTIKYDSIHVITNTKSGNYISFFFNYKCYSNPMKDTPFVLLMVPVTYPVDSIYKLVNSTSSPFPSNKIIIPPNDSICLYKWGLAACYGCLAKANKFLSMPSYLINFHGKLIFYSSFGNKDTIDIVGNYKDYGNVISQKENIIFNQITENDKAYTLDGKIANNITNSTRVLIKTSCTKNIKVLEIK
jgi:hypothetical protein